MSQTVRSPAEQTQLRPRRWPRRLLVVGGILVVLAVGAWFVVQIMGSNRLERARADADRLDPGWRWDDLQAKRAQIADAENSAVTVGNLQALLGTSWDGALNVTPPPEEGQVGSIAERMSQVPPNERLPDDVLAALRQVLSSQNEARALATRLADQPRGRLPIPDGFDYISTALPIMQEGRNVANFLRSEAQLRAHDGDLDGALLMNRCLVNTAGSMNDEPVVLAQLVRIAIDAVAVQNLERILGQGEATAQELEELQKAYERHLDDHVLLTALRGERAYMDKNAFAVGLPGAIQPSNLGGYFESNCATILEFMNRSVETAKLPPGEQREGFNAWERDLKRMASSPYSRWLNYYAVISLPAIQKVAEADFRRQANQGCAVLALAAERYRLQHGKWPEKIEDLQPFVTRIPDDPFGAGPLKLKRTADGLIIYSVGSDGADNEGTLNRDRPMGKGVDMGIQLWDVAKRGQPSKPAKATPMEGNP